ncbi:MAG: hypothetical protein CMF72_09885 [Mameliella sp.]|nr:hypothetical protein [Mameliella sp.]
MILGQNQQPSKRRVFFSFHYQNDVWRANQIRQSWRHQHENTRQSFGFYDGSIWERSKRESDDSLKELIRQGVKNTSVTCILAGSETYERRWVRYEIARSILKGNGLLTVRIHNMRNSKGQISVKGEDPLDCMGVYLAGPDKILLCEKNGSTWERYEDYQQAVTLPASWLKPTSTNVIRLSTYATNHCYATQSGSHYFGQWVRDSAASVG